MPTNIFDMQDTWNNGGTVFNGIKMTVNNAASAATSKLLDLVVGSTSEFSIAPDGIATGETPPPGDNSKKLATTAFVVNITGGFGTGPFLPINNPAATGTLTVAPVAGGNKAALIGTPIGNGSVFIGADGSSTDANVSTNISSKGDGQTKLLSNGNIQFDAWGPAGTTRWVRATGATAAGNALLSPVGGGKVAILDADLTGTPSAPTAAPGTNTTQVATTAFVGAALGGGNAPSNAEYITSVAEAALSNERVLTDSASITWDRTTAGQIKANSSAGGGNVSTNGVITPNDFPQWATTTTIKSVATASMPFVQKAGDTMTGALTINMVAPALRLQRTSGPAQIIGLNAAGTMARWSIIPGNGTAESGSNVGSDFSINRFTDLGAVIDAAGTMTINRATGQTDFANGMTIKTATPYFQLYKSPGQSAFISGFSNNLARWSMVIGDSTAESGSNAGSNFSLIRFNDAGGVIDNAFVINRATGITTFSSDLVVNSGTPGFETIKLSGNVNPGIHFSPTGAVDNAWVYQAGLEYTVLNNAGDRFFKMNLSTGAITTSGAGLTVNTGGITALHAPSGDGVTISGASGQGQIFASGSSVSSGLLLSSKGAGAVTIYGNTFAKAAAQFVAASNANAFLSFGAFNGATSVTNNPSTIPIIFDSPTQLLGMVDGSNAPATRIGEYIELIVAPFQIPAGDTIIAQRTFAAGDWDIWGVSQATSATAGAFINTGLSTTAALDTLIGRFVTNNVTSIGICASVVGPVRFNLTSSTAINVIAQVGIIFPAVGCKIYGRRVR